MSQVSTASLSARDAHGVELEHWRTQYHNSNEASDHEHSAGDSITTPELVATETVGMTSEAYLPPTDRGKEAWKLLCAAFVFEALLWGFPLSYGVFQNYYSQLPQFEDNRYISVVGTVASGMSYLGAPLVAPVIRRWPQYRKQMIWVGWPICILSLVAGSFAVSLPSLILTQGVMYGVGFLAFYYPILSMVDEYWVARRGMAYGLLCAASGVSGTVMPIIIQALLRRYGYQTTLRAIAVGLALCTGPLIPLLKPRGVGLVAGARVTDDRDVGDNSGVTATTTTSMAWMKIPLFWIYTASNLIMGLGYFFPSLYLPSFATSLGVPPFQSALLLSLMSVAQILGQLTFGYLSDKSVPLNALLLTSMLVSSTATFALWGVARSFAPLLVFALVFGFFGAGYTALWARMVSAVSADQSVALMMFSVFCFGKGVGNVLAGPISAGLVMSVVKKGAYGIVKYRDVIIFTSACLAGSGWCVGFVYARGVWKRVARLVVR